MATTSRSCVRRHLVFVPFLSFAAAAAAHAQQKIPISGTVTNESGKPVPGAHVGPYWSERASSGESEFAMQSFQSQTADAEGNFKIDVNFYSDSTPLLAYDKSYKRGGFVILKKADAAKPVSIRVVKLVTAHGSFSCKDLNAPPSWTNIYVSTPDRQRLFSCDSGWAKFEFKLPPGDYEFYGYGSDVKGVVKKITLPAGQSEFDMGVTDLRATGIALHKGKAPPEIHVTDARGVAKTVKLSDYKGKWLLIEFWGFW